MQEIKGFTDYKLSLRNRILDAAILAFAERGIKAVKMDDIAAALTISKRTLYELYDTKEQVIFEAVKRYHQLRRDELMAFAQDSNHDVLDIIIFIYRNYVHESGAVKPTFYDEFEKYPQIVEYMNRERARRDEEFLQFLHRGVAEGYFRADVNYDIIAHLFRAVGSYTQKTRLYEHFTFEELFFNMLVVTLRGICTSRGISKLDQSFAANYR